MNRKYIGSEVRSRIYERDEGKCQYCGEKVYTSAPQGHWRKATIDHFLSLYLGGADNISNYITACGKCNREKSTKIWKIGEKIMSEAATEQQTEQATELRSIRDIIKDLSKPIAQKHLKTRKQGNTELTYIAWYDAVKYLDHYAAGWSYEIVSVWNDDKYCIVKVKITISCLEGFVWREATGVEDLTNRGYGDYVSNACSMALRRAAALFGLGISLYEH